MVSLNLLDVAARNKPNGQADEIAKLLSQTNEVIADAQFVEANNTTVHTVTVQTGLPTVAFRDFNEGVTPGKQTTSQHDEPMAMLEAWVRTDAKLASLNNNKAAYLLQEQEAQMEAMNQQWTTSFFYGNPVTNSKEFLGLAPRYNNLNGPNGQNIIDGANGNAPTTATMTSVWLVAWDPTTIFCAYPKGSTAGLEMNDWGKRPVTQGSVGQIMAAYEQQYCWTSGLCIRDWRYGVRIANLEVGDGTVGRDVNKLQGIHAPSDATAVVTNLLHLMTIAVNKLPSKRGRAAFYMNRTIFTALMRLATESSVGSGLLIQKGAAEFGQPNAMLSFHGVPIRQCDAIVNTESRVA